MYASNQKPYMSASVQEFRQKFSNEFHHVNELIWFFVFSLPWVLGTFVIWYQNLYSFYTINLLLTLENFFKKKIIDLFNDKSYRMAQSK